MKKHQLTELREEIKSNAHSARTYNPRIQASSGLERHALRLEKAGYKYPARSMLLAYGFLRGIPYRVLEQRCHEGSYPWHDAIYKIVIRFNPEITREQCGQWILAEHPLQQAAE